MKSKYIAVIPVIIAAGISCSKTLSVDKPTVNITLSSTEIDGDTLVYHVGDTVSFKFSGSADNLAFYPGVTGYNYDYRDRASLDSVNPVLSFVSERQWGTQLNTLAILATKSLPSLDSSDIANASWTDITSRATLDQTGAAAGTASGSIHLTDISPSPTDTLYVAFKYSGLTGSTQRTWTITKYSLDNVFADQNVNIAAIASESSYWTIFGAPAGGNNWKATTSQLQIVGGTAAIPSQTCWIVSRPMVVGSVVNDKSIAIKNVSDADISEYDYVYSAAGTYKAVWVGFNETTKDKKSVVKTFYIKIVE